MPRYVDAENVLKELCEICEHQKQCENLPKEKRCVEYNIIANEPTADVAPVVHAHWIKERPCHGRLQQYYCSACGQYGVWDDNSGTLLTRYCPNCPAKMDEEVVQ